MHVVTFYSFKGGVGRTMALANVAGELARRGKSVLLVDFDLEAPGLPSFNFGCVNSADKGKPGLVEFIHSWLDTGKSPDVRDFVLTCEPRLPGYGAVSLMPAGILDGQYSEKLQAIDWSYLYEFASGFLLMEDLRAQWSEHLRPDYVLIDSRTGLTDIGGICTRQLPNHIAFVFWPNIQNLEGLKTVLNAIRVEPATRSPISRSFVPSNLPTLDDEHDILTSWLAKFRNELGYSYDEELRIGNYQSLDLVQQTIFTLERPKTRLAAEYRALADAIVMGNENDVDGVKMYLGNLLEQSTNMRRFSEGIPVRFYDERNDQKLRRMIDREWSDPEVYRLLSEITAVEDRVGDAINFAGKALQLQDDVTYHTVMARHLLRAPGDGAGELTAARILGDPAADYAAVSAAVRLLIASGALRADYAESAALRGMSLPEIARICANLQRDRDQARFGLTLLRAGIRRAENKKYLEDWGVALSYTLLLIAAGQFAEATAFIDGLELRKISSRIVMSFNRAMAKWGETGRIPTDLFADFLVLDAQNLDEGWRQSANYAQCKVVALSAVAEKNEARSMLRLAEQAIQSETTAFSCWSYLERTKPRFVHELVELKSWLRDGEPLPAVFRENRQSTEAELG